MKALFRSAAKDATEPREHFPDAWDARLHEAILRANRNREHLRALGYRAELALDSCESTIEFGATSHTYHSRFRLGLSASEYAIVLVNFAVATANSEQTEIDFPVGFASYSWQMPESRRVPSLHVRIWDRGATSRRVNELYRASKLPSANRLMVSVNLAIDHLADVPPDQCWGPWSDDDDNDASGRWPGRASVQVVSYSLSSTY